MNTDHVQYVGVIPSSVPGEPPSVVLLDVSTTFTWLKEFFNVSLTVQNNASHEFYIGNANAKITLPEGMSLAKQIQIIPLREVWVLFTAEKQAL